MRAQAAAHEKVEGVINSTIAGGVVAGLAQGFAMCRATAETTVL